MSTLTRKERETIRLLLRAMRQNGDTRRHQHYLVCVDAAGGSVLEIFKGRAINRGRFTIKDNSL